MTRGNNNPLLPGGGIHHVAIRTIDLAASLKLYRDVLGMRIAKTNELPGRRHLLLDCGDGSHIELAAPLDIAAPANTPEVYHPLQHIALTTTDVPGVIDRVRSAGYEITVEPRDVRLTESLTTIAFFKGPSGELIELYDSHTVGE